MVVKDIEYPEVKFASMVIGYRVYHLSQMNSIPEAAIHTTYQMLKENVDYDLAKASRAQLMLNIESINKDKYEDSICFMVDKDTCQMEVAVTRTSWVMSMGYEIEANILNIYVGHLLSKSVDPNVPRFGTFKEKSIQVHVELPTLEIAKKVRKEEQFSIAQGFTKEMIDEARTRFEEKKAGTSNAPTDRQTRSANVKKENPPPPLEIQIGRKEKQDEPQAPKATGKKKKEQAQRFSKATIEEEAEEIESRGSKKELRASGKKSKVVGAPIVKIVKSQSVQVETKEILKNFLGLVKEEPEMIETSEEEDILEALVIEGELSDIFEIDEIFTQTVIELEGDDTFVPIVTSKEPKDEEMQKDTQESVQIDVEKTTKPLVKAQEKQKEEAHEQKVTYRSLTSKKIIDDDEDDDTMSIQGLINMDMLSQKELMEIASIDTDSLTTPIEKLDHLVTSAGEQMKILGEGALHNVETGYEKKIIEMLTKAIDKDREGLTVNMDQIKEAVKNGGKIMSTICNFSLFLDDIDKKRKESQQELRILSESFDPLNDSTTFFGRFVIVVQHKLKAYEAEQVKRTTSLQELQTHLVPKLQILQRIQRDRGNFDYT
ncbi:uncharacterized protein LOC131874392 [Cryptomeria japonica]|uniref:uncharacterized protein LOC131874392 n=1 Tax=Cryptomeria japonica TaxID=3369 RepID=UPI0027DA65E6|nr:uncharacterized protein LOC131874392 [Cryptomeria japonica]